ncbi:cysteine desulfurase family protein [Zunongwangia sp. F260]|uniref:cysteine desulfurase n=1 Tax=Autumnicola lenta TaxID=3075593 RepID=A0ABU3CJM3_9FLAO|nr:cysteine desulfurase family protein [Zunongwangia sp. F260]MDT0646551.1 cysteine desulfurase family protein [Zunongwangia sp. F260]
MKKVYLDSAATTQIRGKVIDRMSVVMKENFGNPSSAHSYGRSSKTLVEQARKTVASLLNVSASEIIFTSGGTEADNLVLNSAVRDLGVKRIITSRIEHHAVLYTVEQLQRSFGIEVDCIKLDGKGNVVLEDLKRLLAASEEKTLVSLMHVNNEIGNKIDLKEVAEICKANNALFHSDTVQSVGHYQLDLKEIPIDFLAASAHKFHGPKGVGFAFVRKNSGLKPLIFGGEQERGHRAGTEGVHNIVGLEEAIKIAYDKLEEEKAEVLALKKHFIAALKSQIPGVKFNGNCEDPESSTYTLINICLPVSSEKALMLLFQLDLKGIACSKGSACQSGSSKESHVLSAFLAEEDLAKPSIRFSFSKYNTTEEIDYVVEVLKEFIEA